MINLILPSDQRRICRDYRRRLTVVGSLLFLTAIIIAAMVLGAFSIVLIWRGQELTKELAVQAGASSSVKYNEQKEALDTLKKNVKLLALNQPTLLPSLVIRQMAEAKPKGVVVTNFSVAEHEDGGSDLNLVGTAVTRADYLKFVEALRQMPITRLVDAPVANLIREKNINFQLTVNLTAP